MSRRFLQLSRRTFLRSTALGATASAALLQAPAVLRAQGAGVKLGLLHPVTGALSYSGQQGRIGATMAVDEINAAGGIKSLNGAKIEPVLGDAQSTPDGGTAELEKMNSAEVSCVVGGYASSICLAVSQAAARYDLPYVVDVGVADSIVTRGLKNTFRFSPGFGVIAKTALDNLAVINDQAGKPAKTVIIVHEDSLFGSGLATPDVAQALDIRAGSPLIELVRVVFDQSGRAVEHLHALYRPDRYAFEMDLVRSGASGTKAWSPAVPKDAARAVAPPPNPRT